MGCPHCRVGFDAPNGPPWRPTRPLVQAARVGAQEAEVESQKIRPPATANPFSLSDPWIIYIYTYQWLSYYLSIYTHINDTHINGYHFHINTYQ